MVVATAPRTDATDKSESRATYAPLELFAASVALILPVAFLSSFDGSAWSVRAAILLLVAAVGLPVLWSQVREPQPLAARAAVAFLVIGLASALLSGNRVTAFFGLYNQGTGLLFMASLAGAWAIGRRVQPAGRLLVERALIAGVLINVGVGLLAAVVDLPGIGQDVVDATGRSSGLAGNPVHLAALGILGLALVVPRFAARPARWALPAAAIVAAIQLSGTRFALVVAVVIVAWAGRRHGLRVAAMLFVLFVLGLVAGTAMAPSTSTNATARSEQLGSWRTRPALWVTATESLVHHPLLGVGPDQFRTDTSSGRTESIARAEGPDRLFTDAHNLVVEYATTIGLLGVAALLVWLFAAMRPARGWLLVGALGVFAIHMLEPQSVVTTPLAFLALGASAPAGLVTMTGRFVAARRAASWGLVLVALTAAAVFLVGEYEAHQAQLDLTVGPASQAARLLPAWPRTASLLGQAWLFQAISHPQVPSAYQTSRAWRVVAVDRDNTDPALWNDLAEFDESRGENGPAATEFTRALTLDPVSLRAIDGLERLAAAQCDASQARYWQQRADRIAPPTGEPPVPVAAKIAPSCAAAQP